MKTKLIITGVLLALIGVGFGYLNKSPKLETPIQQSQTKDILLGSDSGALSPGTMADDSAVGTVAWSNPDNAKVSDNVYATTTLPLQNDISNYLRATNFGFSIPSGATINGILVEIERKAQLSDEINDSSIKIIKSDGTIGTTNKASGTAWSGVEAYFSYGSSTDLWGETWTNTSINDIDFGIVLSVSKKWAGSPMTASVDHIRITVYYTEGAPAVGGSIESDILMFGDF